MARPNDDPCLVSRETLDRASPLLFEDARGLSPNVPGGNTNSNNNRGNVQPATSTWTAESWMNEFDKDDLEMLQELGILTAQQLVERIRELHSLAYRIGVEESRELTRGKLLGVFGDSSSSTSHSNNHDRVTPS